MSTKLPDTEKTNIASVGPAGPTPAKRITRRRSAGTDAVSNVLKKFSFRKDRERESFCSVLINSRGFCDDWSFEAPWFYLSFRARGETRTMEDRETRDRRQKSETGRGRCRRKSRRNSRPRCQRETRKTLYPVYTANSPRSVREIAQTNEPTGASQKLVARPFFGSLKVFINITTGYFWQ